MLTRIWNCMKRHKKKLIFFSAFFGGGWLTYKWLQRKVQEMRSAEDKEYLERLKRQHHFDSNQRTCNMTVLSMVPNLREALNKVLCTSDITHMLQTNPSNKLALWEELKVVSFARTLTGVYGCCLVTLFLRVQLNVMGGYLFLNTLQNKHSPVNGEVTAPHPETHAVPQVIQERYLSLISYFLGQGLCDLAKFVKQTTAKEVESISLKEQMTIDYVQSVVNAVRERVECGLTELCPGPPTLPLCQYLLPGEQVPDIEVKSTEEELFDRVIKETRDILESADFHLVLQESLERGFSRLMDNLADHYRLHMDAERPQMGLHEVRLPCAKLLPIADGVIGKMLCDAPNPFVQELLLLDQMKNLAANIYEAFSQDHPLNVA